MPEIVILVAAIACVGSVVVLYYNRSNAPATGVAVLSFIAFLYGIGQFVERDKNATKSVDVADAVDRVATQNAVSDVRDKPTKPVEPVSARRQPDAVTDEPVKQLPPPPANDLNALGTPPPAVVINSKSPAVTITNFATYQTSPSYVELSGKVVNNNDFPIKNIVVKCGDPTFATADVSAVLDKVMPPKSDLYIQKVRMGPIKPHLPPTTCQIAKYDRAN